MLPKGGLFIFALYSFESHLMLGRLVSFSLALSCFFSTPLHAQLCTGSLGEPAAWIRFGDATVPVGPLPSAITSYNYTQSSCPNDGAYTLTDISFGCFASSWHTIVGDHTPGDGVGRYMLVNASTDPGTFYTETISGLCGGTTYEFSAFIVNVLKPGACGGLGIDPNLTFTIETIGGTLLTEYKTGSIGELDFVTWRPYGTFFALPTGESSVVLKIINNAPGGCGNDLAIDDITFRPCGPRLDAVLPINGQREIEVCITDNRSFRLSSGYSGGYAQPRFQWQTIGAAGDWQNVPGATDSFYVFYPAQPGTYPFRILVGDGNNINNPICRVVSDPLRIVKASGLDLQITSYRDGCEGKPLNLLASGAARFEWTGPNGFRSTEQNPRIQSLTFSNAGRYFVTGYTAAGCGGTDSIEVVVHPAIKLSVGRSTDICEGQSVQLSASGGTQYLWEPSLGLDNSEIPNPVARPSDSMIYKLLVRNEFDCFDTATVRVNVWKKPKANAGKDQKTLLGRPVELKGEVSGTDIRYSWSPTFDMTASNTTTPIVSPQASFFPQEFIYRLDVTSNRGCGSASDEVKVTVFETIKIPNTFTPNGDGYNDVWEIEILPEFSNAVMEVYNTAGSLVYRTVGYNKPWDGRYKGQLLPAGTYYYIVDLKTQGKSKLTGYITLIR